MSSWRVLDFLGFEGTLDAATGHLVAHYPENDSRGIRTAALEDVHTVLVGAKVTLSAAALQAAGTHGVTVLICDWRGIPVTSVAGFSNHTLAGERQRGQMTMSLPARKQAWKALMTAKVNGQANVLGYAGDTHGAERLKAMARTVRSGDTENVEAAAARLYWSRLSAVVNALSFHREPGQRTDNLNSFLNYGYTVLRGAVTQAVLSAGLWPAAGIHHDNVRNAWCLVDDLIEPLRPAVDNVAVDLYTAQQDIAAPEPQRALVQVLSAPFDSSGASVLTAARSLATSYSLYVAREGKFTAPIWEGDADAHEGS